MKPYLTCILALTATLAAGSAHAGLFGKDKADKAKSQTALPETRVERFRPASEAEIQSALRSDPLAQSAFFSREFNYDPTNARLGIYLSNALRSLGRYDEAADMAHRVLLFAPDNHEALLAAARSHIGGNNAFEAIASLQRAAELKPKDWQAWSLLGVAYDNVKRPQDAQAAWAKALQLSPENPTVLTNMAMSKAQAGDFAGAEPLLRTAVVQKGATIQVRQNLALVLGMQGKMAEAEQLLRQDLPPDQADANLKWLQQAAQARVAATVPAERSWDTVKASGG
ncbi:tetratricopeptide repeat family protein [Asticcacaulis biprosthecium C19]|uniref:Tetratricopeptide repeat family protein n=1 Tax=Asticcacaulis biprosthecium C19 TaxID=715226 RepID=F4QKK0_9CAUL|nr:tetratricopeptide repeat protein [Asticcacaulis biprosthecium]EGF92152.1 tetratricopeptide repeat family protein [Asticcacaulis biprosthecium C19]